MASYEVDKQIACSPERLRQALLTPDEVSAWLGVALAVDGDGSRMLTTGQRVEGLVTLGGKQWRGSMTVLADTPYGQSIRIDGAVSFEVSLATTPQVGTCAVSCQVTTRPGPGLSGKLLQKGADFMLADSMERIAERLAAHCATSHAGV